MKINTCIDAYTHSNKGAVTRNRLIETNRQCHTEHLCFYETVQMGWNRHAQSGKVMN